MGKIKIDPNLRSTALLTKHDESMWRLKLDEDPRGSGLPFKNFITEDKAHALLDNVGRRIKYEFNNGYGLSVLMGDLFYTDELRPYEICPLYKGALMYHALDPNNEDVYPYQTDEDLMIMIVKLMALPPKGESK
jgi:hypothetical protein